MSLERAYLEIKSSLVVRVILTLSLPLRFIKLIALIITEPLPVIVPTSIVSAKASCKLTSIASCIDEPNDKSAILFSYSPVSTRPF